MRLTPDRSTVTSLAGLAAMISNHACAASSTQGPASSPFSLSVATAVMVSILGSLRFAVCEGFQSVCVDSILRGPRPEVLSSRQSKHDFPNSTHALKPSCSLPTEESSCTIPPTATAVCSKLSITSNVIIVYYLQY